MRNPRSSSPNKHAVLSKDEGRQEGPPPILSVLAALGVLSSFPLVAGFFANFGRNNSLDHDSIVEAMALTVLIIFAGTILASLAKIQWSRGHLATGSDTMSVLGPLIWHHGHHPPLPRFKNHELSIRGKRYCCGCIGASIGIIAGSMIMALVELADFSQKISIFMLFGGLILVAAALTPYGIKSNPTAPFRLIANIFLPVGLCLVIASARVNHPASNLVLLLGGLTFALFLIIRSRLSGFSHIAD
ncbi:MAG: hypothetical protein ACE5OZ_00550 [Candidatus Heimdallarchaeota archaeon]